MRFSIVHYKRHYWDNWQNVNTTVSDNTIVLMLNFQNLVIALRSCKGKSLFSMYIVFKDEEGPDVCNLFSKGSGKK